MNVEIQSTDNETPICDDQKAEARWEFNISEVVELAADSDCVSHLQNLVYSATTEVERLRVILLEDQVQLDVWDQKLRYEISRRMLLREAIWEFFSSEKLAALRDAIDIDGPRLDEAPKAPDTALRDADYLKETT